MKILLIGNGFDLEHDLPTSYRDFLAFCLRARRIFTLEDENLATYREKNIDGWEIDTSIKKALLAAFQSRNVRGIQQEAGSVTVNSATTQDERLNEIYEHIRDNAWIDYFLNCSSLGENWIDFESEISRVIQSLDAGRVQLSHGTSIDVMEKSEKNLLLAILKSAKGNWQGAFDSVRRIDRFSERLLKDLERLIRALEIYIAGFVREIEITQKSPDIKKLCPDCILSFNYSNTYQRVYDPEKKLSYNYIHGKADMDRSVETSNLVLGIDEYLDTDRKNIDLEFLPFKKYYQRIYKSTENAYLEWYDRIQADDADYYRKVKLFETGNPDPLCSFPGQKRYYLSASSIKRQEHTLYIFGHSMDITDRDVLRLLICNDNVQTKIYYHRKSEQDKAALGGVIRNLVKIIGQDELIRRTGGAHKTIEFIPQTLRKPES